MPNRLSTQQRWRHRLNFYAFVAHLMGEGDIYPPTDFYRSLSAREVVSAWKKTATAIRKRKAPREIGIFVFVPFCKSKCVFCPFFSFPLASRRQLDVFTESLLREINFFKGVFDGVEFNTLWFGGGTPSILEGEHLKKIFAGLHRIFPFAKDAQITFECSCSSTNYNKLKLLHELGVNRITLGIQSLNDRVLKINNRLFQDKALSLRLIRDTRKIGIPIVNVDLMCGLPGDTLSSFTKGLSEIISLEPDLIHINPFFPSAETNFYRLRREYTKSDMERRSKEAEVGTEMIMAAGYDRVGGAFLGFSRRENVANQQELDRVSVNSSYVSLGPASHGHAFGQLFYSNVDFRKKWDIPVLPKYRGIEMDLKEEMRKHMVTNLRYVIYRDKFKELFGGDIIDAFRKEIGELRKFDLIYIDKEKVRLKIKTRQEQLILAKHFFNPKYLRGIEKAFGVRYNPNRNYFREIAKLIDISV